MHAICRPAILEIRRNHHMFLYFHALLPYVSQSLVSGILRWAEIKLHISGHGGIVKVGVKQILCSEKTKFTWFVVIKGWSKYAKQNKTLELEFCKKTSSAICAIFDIRCCYKVA